MNDTGIVMLRSAFWYCDIVTLWLLASLQYVFREGTVDMERLKALVGVVGKERLVLDLSCRKKVSPRCTKMPSKDCRTVL